MSGYFKYHGVVDYDVRGDGIVERATDITRRFRIRELVADGTVLLYDYEVKDGERPDVVAYKYYGDPRLDWLVLLVNDVVDPHHGWPMEHSSLNSYVAQTYGSVSVAMGTVHHREQILQARTTVSTADGETVVSPERSVVVDETTFLTLAPSARREVDCYQYEVDRNDALRRIRLIDRRYVPLIERTLATAYGR